MIQYLRAGTIKRIHVDKQIIRRNLKEGRNDPTVTVQTSKGSMKAIRATVLGPGEMVQSGTFRRDADGSYYTVKALGCGARVWYETKSAVEVVT